MSGKYSGLTRPQQQNKHRTEQCVEQFTIKDSLRLLASKMKTVMAY